MFRSEPYFCFPVTIKEELILKISDKKDEIKKFHQKYNGGEESLDLVQEAVAKVIRGHFGVSWEVIKIRFRAEHLDYLFKPEWDWDIKVSSKKEGNHYGNPLFVCSNITQATYKHFQR